MEKDRPKFDINREISHIRRDITRVLAGMSLVAILALSLMSCTPANAESGSGAQVDVEAANAAAIQEAAALCPYHTCMRTEFDPGLLELEKSVIRLAIGAGSCNGTVVAANQSEDK